MGGIFLIIPLFLIRYGLLSVINKKALRRASHFPPMEGLEIVMYWIYQVATMGLLIGLVFTRVDAQSRGFIYGVILYAAGTILFTISTLDFSNLRNHDFCCEGVYRFSRNPMYVSYLLYFIGSALMTKSLPLLIIVLIYQLSAHWIIKAEERWCINQFGELYLRYMKKVRRYV